MKIKSSDISVVIQGSIEPIPLKKCVDSILKHLPDCEIILSTWEGSQANITFPLNKIILNTDPGAKPISSGGALNNTNRQIVSTINGVNEASRPYTLKFRSDCVLNGVGFIEAFGKYTTRSSEHKLFQEKIVAPRYASRIETAKRPYLFHPADIALFGLTTDIKRLFDIDLVTQQEFEWAKNCTNPSTKAALMERDLLCKWVPEQHIFIKALVKGGFKINLEHAAESTPQLATLSQKLLINNYIIIPECEFGLLHQKDKLRLQVQSDIITCYSKSQYEYLYRLFFDSTAPRQKWSSEIYGQTALDFKIVEGLLKHSKRTRLYAATSGMYGHKFLAEAAITLFWIFKFTLHCAALLLKKQPKKHRQPIKNENSNIQR
ncbi:WavE lipopolysaccharide synthesis family protein [Aquabacterium sp.]|uniref:WavE lipopolysaccharide synthesis family protein n=1 Tax=Aquabacterium sp. TaxID=1872578 RepID=UPI0025BB9424|nr:WavE lipopolysaccharide synthesis family protein [Aquabacterium sp.]